MCNKGGVLLSNDKTGESCCHEQELWSEQVFTQKVSTVIPWQTSDPANKFFG